MFQSWLIFSLCLTLLLLLNSFSIHTLGTDVPGARGSVAGIGGWSWTYLDPTPRDSSIPFPFELGVADRDQRDQRGERFVPAIRYAHVAVQTKDAMIISHGYQYDMSPRDGGAIWLSDTWRFTFSTHRWSRLHDHVRHPNEGPVARYAAVAALVGGDLYMHGGDDGGNAARLPSYKHAVYGDMWRFILTPSNSHSHQLHSWVRIRTAVSSSPIGHSAHLPSILDPRIQLDDFYRCQHASVLVPLDSTELIFQADSDLEKTKAIPSNQIVPYLFVTHGLYAVERPNVKGHSTSNVLVEDFDVVEGEDLFVFSFRTKEWRQMKTSAPPPARFGHSLVYVGGAINPQTNLPSGGSIYLYGGFTRMSGNRGDLWELNLQTVGSRIAYTWRELHSSYPNGASLSPGSRGYYNFYYTPDDKLHHFGGARCDPGCICSAEYWIFHLDRQQWELFEQSPYSPASSQYPARAASGAPSYNLYATPDESVKKGYPTHRYKQSLVSRPVPVDGVYSAHIFGGESYNPSGYYHDVWRFDYKPSAIIPSSVAHGYAQLDELLHFTPLASFDRPLPSHRRSEPKEFYRHQPPDGWGAYQPKQQIIHTWPSSDDGYILVRSLSQPTILVPVTLFLIAIALLSLIWRWSRRSSMMKKYF